MIIWLWFKEIMVIFWNKKIWLVAGCWWRCLTKKNIKIQDSPNGILNKRTAEYVVFPASTNTNFETLFMYWICSFWVSTSQFDKGIHRCNCEREVKKTVRPPLIHAKRNVLPAIGRKKTLGPFLAPQISNLYFQRNAVIQTYVYDVCICIYDIYIHACLYIYIS